MDKKRILLIMNEFDSVAKKTEEHIEFWYARDLMGLLGYEQWRYFENVINHAIESCEASEIEPLDHFREVTKMVALGSGPQRQVRDYMLTRYACYLIAMNGDTSKEEIAFAQS